VLAGEYGNQHGVVRDPNTHVLYLDVTLDSDARFIQPLEHSHSAFVYVFEGAARIGQTHLSRHSLGVLGEGDSVELVAGEDGARFILVAGKPIREPIAQYGPFVMNTREEIEQAFHDYQSGHLVQKKASMTGA
jgi:hypothetical protein